ncbi:chemotaxis protein CheC [Halobacillus hunanensis]|uniref:chemotaxis protein CheC n=1 Tax=Halobacillus hunanensis TaxID=578214 RepID=UPI0009A7DC51|nr:chemotaxis protein CheC [Halobacillus hunanensis]
MKLSGDQVNFSDEFSPFHLDVLKEIANIGAGHAATSLSKLLDNKIDMCVPSVKLAGFNEVMELAGGAETEVVSVMFRLEGDAPGLMFFILSPQQADQFVTRMTGRKSYGQNLNGRDEIGESALRELGNIVVGSYLSALSDLTHVEVQLSVPFLTIDMAGAILSSALVELACDSDRALVIETSLVETGPANSSIDGCFFFLPDADSSAILLKSLGVLGSR